MLALLGEWLIPVEHVLVVGVDADAVEGATRRLPSAINNVFYLLEGCRRLGSVPIHPRLANPFGDSVGSRFSVVIVFV